MVLRARPAPDGADRKGIAEKVRRAATDISTQRPRADTVVNTDEAMYDDQNGRFPGNFTKGLFHDRFGLVANPVDYDAFVDAINTPPQAQDPFAVVQPHGQPFFTKIKDAGGGAPVDAKWRGWESPRAGHVYDLEGPDAGSVGMAPAPELGSSELALEMGEVYAMALLRDVPFTDIVNGTGKSQAGVSVSQVCEGLNSMKFMAAPEDLNKFEKRRRAARGKTFTPDNLFRGSTPGARNGPYISQFMLMGNVSRDGGNEAQDGFIQYGTQLINQRGQSHR